MLIFVYFENFFLVHYYISEERVDMVTQQFEDFNKNFREIESVFKEVTGVNFVFGQKFPDVGEQVQYQFSWNEICPVMIFYLHDILLEMYILRMPSHCSAKMLSPLMSRTKVLSEQQMPT